MKIQLDLDDSTQIPRIQELLDVQNSTRQSAGNKPFDLTAFVQSEIEDHFAIKPEQSARRKSDAIAAKIAAADPAKLDAIAAAVDAAVKP